VSVMNEPALDFDYDTAALFPLVRLRCAIKSEKLSTIITIRNNRIEHGYVMPNDQMSTFAL
jgi:hypothetical protein